MTRRRFLKTSSGIATIPITFFVSKIFAKGDHDLKIDTEKHAHDRIQPYSKNRFYWQFKGDPILLLGGSVEDNLFQIPDLEAHLDLLKSVGGNYVRCTMSSRDEDDIWPFEKTQNGDLYDLDQPGSEYWERFERFLDLASDREIIAQFEMWDRFDFARDPWQLNPYNPKNNINYSEEESGLKTEIWSHPGQRESAFFRSVPKLENNQLLLKYQHSQVDKMLSISLKYPNTLYCMDNETNESPEWGWYWAKQIRQKARDLGVEVEMTEMWDSHNLLSGGHVHTFDHPEIYSFVDISQNNHRSNEEHWQKPQAIRKRIIDSGQIRPMNSVKIYGKDPKHFGTTRDAQERFWRNIFGGLASSRFHRPSHGLGLSEISQTHIRSMRMLTDQIDIFNSEPHNDLISDRDANEAYCTADLGVSYAVFFPNGGNVILEVSDAKEKIVSIRWLDIRRSEWSDREIDQKIESDHLCLETEEGYWAVLVSVKN